MEALGEFWKETLHADALEGGILNSGVIGVKLYVRVSNGFDRVVSEPFTSIVRVVGIW